MTTPWHPPRAAMREAERALTALLAAWVLLVAVPGQAQQQQEEANNGQDPTRPLTRVDVRYKDYHLFDFSVEARLGFFFQ